MPVDTPHAEYAALINVWRMIRDVMGGSRFIKAAGRLYLPELADQNPLQYEKYKKRAVFFNATGIAVAGIHGLIFAKEPIVKSPALIEDALNDVTLQGTKFIDYAKDIVKDQVTVGRVGTLIDFDPDEKRPYVVKYGAENILNWKTDRVKGDIVLTLLVLFEYDSEYIPVPGMPAVQVPDEFDTTQYEQWRVYRMQMDDASNPFVTCQVYRRTQQQDTPRIKKRALPGTGPATILGKGFSVVKDYVPTRRSITLSQIPFVFHGSEDGKPDCDKPPIEDLCEINISHYMTSADLENGRHLAGLPQPYVTGHKAEEDDDEMSVGSTVLWTFSDPTATVGYLEVTSSFESLSSALDQKQQQMAVLGVRMLEPQKAGVEAADTQRLRLSSQTSSLTTVALTGSATLSTVLKWLFWWSGTVDSVNGITDDTCEIVLNTDFLDESMNPLFLQQLLAALVARKISYETFFNMLKKGEVIEADRTLEEEQAAIETDSLTMPPPPAVAPPGPTNNPPTNQNDPPDPTDPPTNQNDPPDPTDPPTNQPPVPKPKPKKKKPPVAA
jgi:hypothetical protein